MPRRSHRLAVVSALIALCGVLGACGGPAAKSASTSTLPPLPPDVVGYLTLIGSGQSVGEGASVVPVDLTASLVGRPIAEGNATYPDAIAISARTHMAYVANYATNTVTPIDLRTRRAGKPINAGDGPAGIAVSPNGKMAYVTDAGTTPIGDTVTPINLKTDKALPAITVGAGPQGIAITPNGKTAYVADAGAIVSGQAGPVGHTVTPIALDANRVLVPINVGNGPLGVAITPDGQTAYVTNSYSGSVSPIDTATNTPGVPIEVSGAPQAVAITPDGARALVANAPSSVSNASTVSEIAVSTNAVTTSLAVPKGPSGIAIAPNGQTAWVVCFSANVVAPIVLGGAHLRLGASISVPGGAYAMALATQPQGTFSVTGATGAGKHPHS